MNHLKPVLIVVFALVLVLVVISLVKRPNAESPVQTAVLEENLNSDLNSLDATDLDTGTDTQLDQLSSDSSTF